jgi:hypothetical protein
MHPPPLRGRPILAGKRVLLIDPHQPTREVRARVLLSRGIEVHVAENLSAARFLWRPGLYDLILLETRRNIPEEVLAFYEQISDASPQEHFAFLVGPPKYLSLALPNEFRAVGSGNQQWQETVHRLSAAA